MCVVPNQISCCLDCIHPIDESGQCLIAKMFEKPVNPEHGCSWRIPIRRKAVVTKAELIDKKRTEAKVFLIARFFIDRPDQEVELVKSVIHRCCEEIDKQPTIEREERHGRWETWGYVFHGIEWKRCSRCGKCADVSYYGLVDGIIRMSTPTICGGCGARMDGGADN